MKKDFIEGAAGAAAGAAVAKKVTDEKVAQTPGQRAGTAAGLIIGGLPLLVIGAANDVPAVLWLGIVLLVWGLVWVCWAVGLRPQLLRLHSAGVPWMVGMRLLAQWDVTMEDAGLYQKRGKKHMYPRPGRFKADPRGVVVTVTVPGAGVKPSKMAAATEDLAAGFGAPVEIDTTKTTARTVAMVVCVRDPLAGTRAALDVTAHYPDNPNGDADPWGAAR